MHHKEQSSRHPLSDLGDESFRSHVLFLFLFFLCPHALQDVTKIEEEDKEGRKRPLEDERCAVGAESEGITAQPGLPIIMQSMHLQNRNGMQRSQY